MENAEIRKFIHDMRNALNSANISVVHLRLNGSKYEVILERLERALGEATQLLVKLESPQTDKMA